MVEIHEGMNGAFLLQETVSFIEWTMFPIYDN